MGLLDNNNVRVLQQTNIITESNKSVTTGTIKVFTNLKNPYACIRIEATSTGMRLALLDQSISGQAVYLPIYNIFGSIQYVISASGTYYIPISGVLSVNLYSLTTLENQTINYSFFELTTKPEAIELKPIQVFMRGTKTLTSGATQSEVQMTSTDDVFLYKKFKFFAVNAVYRNSSDANVTKTTFSISKMDFLQNNIYANPVLIESVANKYSIQTSWQPRTAMNTKFIFDFNAASDGDKIYYEIIGIR